MKTILDLDKEQEKLTDKFYNIFQSNSELFQKFANEVLSKDKYGDEELNEHGKILNISQNINITREESHIDLLVTDKNNVIVIENKIKSGINGIKYDIHGEEIGSQLYGYYNYVNGLKQKSNDVWVQDSELINKFGNKDKHFFIFAPDYNSIDTSKIQYVPKGTYITIPYSKIYAFYNKYQKYYADKIPYYNEFLYAIGKHINNVDNSLEIEMHKKFAKVIESK